MKSLAPDLEICRGCKHYEQPEDGLAGCNFSTLPYMAIKKGGIWETLSSFSIPIWCPYILEHTVKNERHETGD